MARDKDFEESPSETGDEEDAEDDEDEDEEGVDTNQTPAEDDDESSEAESDSDPLNAQEPDNTVRLSIHNQASVEFPAQRIRDSRRALVKKITSDPSCKDEKVRSKYKEEVMKCHEEITQNLLATSDEPSEPSFLRYCLDSHHVLDLEVLKLLLELGMEIDPLQLGIRYQGETPLQKAVLIDNDYRTHKLTKHLCTLLAGAHISKANRSQIISITNERKETCIHLAVRYDIDGVEDLINLADERALEQPRSSPGEDDGNTALHDLLSFHFYAVSAPICQIKPSSRPKASRGRSSQQESTTAGASGDAVDPTKQKSIKLERSPQPKKATSKPCQTCVDANATYAPTKSYREKVLNLLLSKHLKALTIQNSAGLSPYLYHIATRKQHQQINDVSDDKVVVTVTITQQPPSNPSDDPSQVIFSPVQRVPTGLDKVSDNPKTMRNEKGFGFVSSSKMNAKQSRDPKGSRVEEGPNPKGSTRERQSSYSGGTGETTPVNFDVSRQPEQPTRLTVGSSGRVKGAVRTLKPKHSSPLSTLYQLSGEIEELLREIAFVIGGYNEAHRCLFHSTVPGDYLDDSERRKTWQPPKRVNSRTPAMYDFLDFEPTLALVVLNRQAAQQSVNLSEEELQDEWKEDMEALKEVFRWLKEDKGVKRIVKLVVKENPFSYCDDETIETCITGLDIRYLHWNRPDLCVSTLQLLPGLVEVWLYSSGINAVLWSWSDNDGLRKLSKLRNIHLHAKRGRETVERNRQNIKHFTKRLNDYYKNKEQGLTAPKIHPDDIEDSPPEPKKESDDLGNGPSTYNGHPWMRTLSTFTARLLNLGKVPRKEKIKVAILDDGVDPEFKGLGPFLAHTGWPSERLDDEGPPFYYSTKGHGSEMAWLVSYACPFVELYVAKIDTPQDDSLPHPTYSVKQAATAVEWAIGQGVQIISMSWCVQETKENKEDLDLLKKAIGKAADKEILMYCAANDTLGTSTSSEPYWPSEYKDTKSIGAADKNCSAMGYVSDSSVDYLFPSESVFPGNDDVGNSGATALASGFAALLLFCLKREGYELKEKAQAEMDKVFSWWSEKKFVHIREALTLLDGDNANQACRNVVSRIFGVVSESRFQKISARD